MKRYRVNRSEYLGLYKMDNYLAEAELIMKMAPDHKYTDKQWNKLQNRIGEIKILRDKANYIGALVDWPTLKRIREIEEEQECIGCNSCLADVIPFFL